jgi:hypothetical protein
MPKPLKLLITYNYIEEPLLKLLCAKMLEDAFRRREDVRVFHTGEVEPTDVDVVFNTLPLGDACAGRLTAWWDIEACSYHKADCFGWDIVLAPYSSGDDYVYPEGKTFLFPFATDPNYWRKDRDVAETYDVGFVGRGDGNRHKRMEWLHYLNEHVNFLWTNNVERGVAVSQLLSSAKILIQVSGDAAGGVMETRFFECGLIGPMAADMTATNRRDMEWAAEPGYHFIAFESKEEMVEKIQRMLADDKARRLMFTRAKANYLKRHTYDVRAREFLETIGFLSGQGLPDFHTHGERSNEWKSRYSTLPTASAG